MSYLDEKTKWNLVYGNRLKNYNVQTSVFGSNWWKKHYQNISDIGTSLLDQNRPVKVLETGCGTGRNSLMLIHPALSITFVDIAKNALVMAKKTAQKLGVKHTLDIREANLFSLPIEDSVFDLSWNVGALEHYSEEEILVAIREMLRVTKNGGYVVIGFPNPKSLAYKKADFLGNSKFNFFTRILKGYRNDTEIAYNPPTIHNIISSISQKIKKRTIYTSNLTFVESPEFINKLSIPLEKYLAQYRFIYLIIIEK